MSVSRFFGRVSRALFTNRSVLLSGVAILSGQFAFAGSGCADEVVILAEDFESDGDDSWGGGTDVFGAYNSSLDLSGSPHSSIPNGGARYSHLVNSASGGSSASINGGPLTSAPIDLVTSHTQINFDGWLAGWTVDNDHARFEAEFFDGAGGAGTSLGNIVLADGKSSDNVLDSIGPTGSFGEAWNIVNWSHYASQNPIPTGALSVTIQYIGDAILANGNDAYTDNIVISTSSVPEPSTAGFLCLASAVFCLKRRRNCH